MAGSVSRGRVPLHAVDDHASVAPPFCYTPLPPPPGGGGGGGGGGSGGGGGGNKRPAMRQGAVASSPRSRRQRRLDFMMSLSTWRADKH